MKDYYSQYPKLYHEATFHIDPTAFLAPLENRLRSGASILDVGCGSGRDLLWFKKRGYSVCGLERSPGLAQLARRNVQCKILEEDFESFAFDSLSVDAMIFVGTFVHVDQESFPSKFLKCTAALKQDGFVLLTMKEGRGSWTDSKGRTFFLWPADDLKEIFENLGLSILDSRQNESKLGTGEVWLSYVLRRTNDPR